MPPSASTIRVAPSVSFVLPYRIVEIAGIAGIARTVRATDFGPPARPAPLGLRTERVEMALQHLQRRPQFVDQGEMEGGHIERPRAGRRPRSRARPASHAIARTVPRTGCFEFAAPHPGIAAQGFEVIEIHRVVDASSRFMRFGVLKNRKKP
ncbi:hypothetical protein RO07_25450 [Pandoraea pulmonicola]|uniref:Uncharacterized protein n=1 Tax=Pandoraea pulmonicola TaxID=93221 RepID=A0ABN4UE81_PANPU|nr:hypothetical protein RO07_25450 [Pandoraea pulmonicola]